MSVVVKQFQKSLKSLLRSLISNVCIKKIKKKKKKYENTAFPRTRKHNLEKKKISKLEKRLKKKNLEYAEYFFPL